MLEYLYLSVLDDGERFEFTSIDTLSHPLDFLDEMVDVRRNHMRAAETQSLNRTEIYGCFGPDDEASVFWDDVVEEACGLRKPLALQSESEDPENDAIKAACADILCTQVLERSDSKIGICRWRDEDTSFAIFLLMDGAAYPSRGHCQMAIEQLAEAWLEQEEPFLLHRQVMTNGFVIHGVKGKRIISSYFNGQTHEWELLLEGARRISLQDGLFYVGAQTDSSIVGSWTEPDVESIILNPINGFGICFEPYEIVEDWLKALLYLFALSFYESEWNAATLRVVYIGFLDLLKERFSFTKARGEGSAVGEELFLKAFREMARCYADSLRGIEESELTRRFASEMPSRVYQLKALKPLLQRHGALGIQDSQKKTSFDRKKFSELLNECSTGSAAQKGRALEDATAYMLEALSDWCLAGRRVKADDCEIDLCYVNRSFSQKVWNLGCMLLVECKNRAGQTGVSVLRNLSFVMDAKGAKAGLIVSASRFTKVVQAQVQRLALQGKIIFLIDGPRLKSIADGMNPNAVFSEQYNSLMSLIEDDFGLFC